MIPTAEKKDLKVVIASANPKGTCKVLLRPLGMITLIKEVVNCLKLWPHVGNITAMAFWDKNDSKSSHHIFRG